MLNHSLTRNAFLVLKTHNPYKKCFLTFLIFNNWHKNNFKKIGESLSITKPERPYRPFLLSPKYMPKRRGLNKINARINMK